jgi:hypothetical protein
MYVTKLFFLVTLGIIIGGSASPVIEILISTCFSFFTILSKDKKHEFEVYLCLFILNTSIISTNFYVQSAAESDLLLRLNEQKKVLSDFDTTGINKLYQKKLVIERVFNSNFKLSNLKFVPPLRLLSSEAKNDPTLELKLIRERNKENIENIKFEINQYDETISALFANKSNEEVAEIIDSL